MQGKVAWGWITKKTYARAIFSRRGRSAIIGALSKRRAQPGPSRTKSSHSSILGMDTRETCFYFVFIDNSQYKPYSGTRVFLITNTNLNKRFFGEILNKIPHVEVALQIFLHWLTKKSCKPELLTRKIHTAPSPPIPQFITF